MTQQRISPVLIVHGGAWAIPDDMVEAHLQGVREALTIGWRLLERGSSAMDAVEAAIVSMEETPRGKPDPEVFLLGARRLGISPTRCIVIEDAPVGIQAAKAGGMRAVGVTFVGHHSAEKLQSAGADLVVANLEQVSTNQLRTLVSRQA